LHAALKKLDVTADTWMVASVLPAFMTASMEVMVVLP
jgi:hypothetical protein